MDKFWVYRPLLNLIGKAEGTDKARGYNETLAYGAYTGGAVDLVSMTLNEVIRLQTKMLQHPKNKWNSSAAGRYQIVRTTLRSIRKALPDRYPSSRLFDEECQDEMACYLLGLRGIDKYLSGRLSEDTLINNLAKEWASFPTTEDKGYYAGQKGPISSADVRKVLAEVKARHADGQPMKEVEVKVPEPTVPQNVEDEVKQKTSFWQWLLGVFTSGSLSLAWLAGMNWQAIVALGGVVIVFLFILLILRRQLVAAVEDIRKVVEGQDIAARRPQ